MLSTKLSYLRREVNETKIAVGKIHTEVVTSTLRKMYQLEYALDPYNKEHQALFDAVKDSLMQVESDLDLLAIDFKAISHRIDEVEKATK